MQRKDFYLIGIIWFVAVLIYYPLASANYLYADEAIQLWLYKPGTGFSLFTYQGRWLTERLFYWLFGSIDTIHQVAYLRLFSLAGWLVCLPVWYTVLKRFVSKEPAYSYLPFFTCLYLVTSLPFSVTVHWAACLELFIANTFGLLSGYIMYRSIGFINNRLRVSVAGVAGAVALGLISLFTYQSGFCCFVIPFLLHFIMQQTTKKDQVWLAGVAAMVLVCVFYFPLFKLSMRLTHMPNFERTDIHVDPLDKIPYFFTHPFERSFWLNIIVYEYDAIARIFYKVMFVGWMVLAFVRFMRGAKSFLKPLKYIAGVMLLFLLSYFPSMIVKENFASNRSQLALDICVWLVMIEMFLYFIKNKIVLKVTGVAIALILTVSAWYNLRYQFLRPVTKECAAIKDFLKQHYHPGIKNIYAIKAPVDAFVNKYHLFQNMDEFGVPSTTFDWGAEFVTRQLVYEITGDRRNGEQLNVKQYPDMEFYIHSGDKLPPDGLLIDFSAIINAMPQ